MHYIWDENKRLQNLRKHGFDFADCAVIFENVTYTYEDDRYPYHERRFITLGLLQGHVVLVAHTENEDVIQVISIRKAKRHEQEAYFKHTSFPGIPD